MVDLKPGDHILVKTDAFIGQRRKLKNRWNNNLWMVMCHIADNITDIQSEEHKDWTDKDPPLCKAASLVSQL